MGNPAGSPATVKVSVRPSASSIELSITRPPRVERRAHNARGRIWRVPAARLCAVGISLRVLGPGDVDPIPPRRAAATERTTRSPTGRRRRRRPMRSCASSPTIEHPMARWCPSPIGRDHWDQLLRVRAARPVSAHRQDTRARSSVAAMTLGVGPGRCGAPRGSLARSRAADPDRISVPERAI